MSTEKIEGNTNTRAEELSRLPTPSGRRKMPAQVYRLIYQVSNTRCCDHEHWKSGREALHLFNCGRFTIAVEMFKVMRNSCMCLI